jgi:protein-tyrosine-phosphatase/DNA-binding transcriptional ArsR family regulator
MTMSDRVPVPLLMRMAAHPLRWALMTELAASDRRVRELVAAVDEPQNLVSYHLRLLRTAGLVTVRRSSFDGRDSYYHLDLARCATAFGDAATALHPALTPPRAPLLWRGESPTERGWPKGCSVLFLCTGNSARSPMAEALLRHRSGGEVDVASAGSRPKPALHPNTERVLRKEYGIDLEPRQPQSLDALAGRRFDYVITLCDKIREVPRDHGSAVTMHWSLPDPSAADTDRATYPEFRRVAIELDTRIGFLPL